MCLMRTHRARECAEAFLLSYLYDEAPKAPSPLLFANPVVSMRYARVKASSEDWKAGDASLAPDSTLLVSLYQF